MGSIRVWSVAHGFSAATSTVVESDGGTALSRFGGPASTGAIDGQQSEMSTFYVDNLGRDRADDLMV